MPTFKIAGLVTISCWTEVEASSEAEALKIAQKRRLAEFHIDSTYVETECWHMDADGMPFGLRVDD